MAKKKVRPTKVQPSGKEIDFDTTLKALKKNYPDAHCALHFTTPFQLLIATILSAQCTDERVNIVTEILFLKHPDAASMNQEDVENVEELIRSTGFYKNKAKNIKQTCALLMQNYKGQVPKTMDELYALPGVGRKTANVVLGNAYGIPDGVVVDTHVTRLSNRFGWVKIQDAVKIEQVLNQRCPQKDWVLLPHLLISHGRAICKARSPDCENCFLNRACPKIGL